MTEGIFGSFGSIENSDDLSAISTSNMTHASHTLAHQEIPQPRTTSMFIGRSGKAYKADAKRLDNLRIDDQQLCLLCTQTKSGFEVLWIGSGRSLVHDQGNRAEFLSVANVADKAFVIDIEDSAAQSIATWDLQHTLHQFPSAA